MAEDYSVVIIGAGFAGLSAAHHLLKNIFPTLGATNRKYKITIVSPSSKFFHRISAPRALINPQLQALDAGLKDINPGLEQYGDQVKLLLGSATEVDPTSKSVSYTGTEGGPSGSISYDSLILSSGADAMDGGEYWGITCGTEKLRQAYEDIHNRIEGAKSILIAGGGPVGVETAGEICDRFPGGKDITLISGTTRLLASIDNQRFGTDAERKLVSRDVKVVHQVRVQSATKNPDSSTSVVLDNGETLVVDMYLPSSGLKANSSYLPKSWVNSNGQAVCDPRTFRLEVADINNVYGFGSVASYSDGTLFDVKFAMKTLGDSFKVDQINETGGSAKQKSLYSKVQNHDLQLTPIGRADGVIVIKGWRLFSFMCVFIKSRTFFVEQTPQYTHGKGV